MDDRTRIGAAVVGGYILGRTKKGRAALRLAMWLSGSDYRPIELARTGATQVTQSVEATKLIEQLRGPLMVAAQRAAQAAVEAQVGRLTQGIQRRTESLTGAVGPATETVTRPLSKATGSVAKKAKLQQDAEGEEGEETGQYNEAEEPEEKQEEGEEGGEVQDAGQYDEAQGDEKEEREEDEEQHDETAEEQADRPRAGRDQDSSRPTARESSQVPSGPTRRPSSGREAARGGRRTR
jgi:hypothetical protein